MWFIIEIHGCLPYVDFVQSEDGVPRQFKTRDQAKQVADKICAWGYKLVEF